MPAKPRKKKSTSNTSLVPVLFTLGVIGWGFFAIERLTAPVNPGFKMASVEAHDLAQPRDTHHKSWKQTAETFLNKFWKTPKIINKMNYPNEFDSWHAVEPSFMESETEDNEEKKAQDYEINENKGEYLLFFYTEQGDSLSLVPVSHKINNSFSLKNIFSQIIFGPDRRSKSLIDSFPVKPTVLDASLHNQNLILNMDDNFGHGISFETAELQIKQLLKTASQFKNIKKLTFRINGEHLKSIQIDGLSLPSTFTIN